MAPMTLATPTLHTARLRLRPFTDADADRLLHAAQQRPRDALLGLRAVERTGSR